jgi:hypothetical protein
MRQPHILDRKKKIWLFGSNEITTMILDMKTLLLSVKYGGFLEFDSDTIKNTNKWLNYLINDDKYKLVIECLDIYIDRLDFDIINKEDMQFYLSNISDNLGIPFQQSNSIYYSRLHPFTYIGIKYFNYSYDTMSD